MRLLTFGQIHIECIYKKSLAGVPIKNIAVSTGYLKVSTPEAIAVDMLCYIEKSGGLNHIATVLSELIESIDPDKLLALAKASDEVAWVQRLGYILEKLEPMGDNTIKIATDRLARHLSAGRQRYIPLASEIGTEGFQRSKKWHIIENATIESDL